MSNESDKAKWDALAEMLGANVGQAEGPLPPRQETKVVPRIHLDLPPPPRKKADWDSLATNLGAEVTHQPSPPAESSPKEDRAPVERRTTTRVVRTPQPSRESAWPGEAARATDESLESRLAEHVRQESEVEKQSLDSELTPAPDEERRPARRRRRRGQRQRDDSGGARSARSEAESDETFQRRSDVPPEREPSDRRELGNAAKRSGHKSVPSWAEAISLMIDGNLASRSTRRRSGPNGGRPRGRRGGKRS
jgi:hypothetical protein